MLATADFALLLLFLAIVAAVAGVSLGHLPRRLFKAVDDWFYQRSLRQEQIKQERLRTAILEEKLRNEVMKDLLHEDPPPKAHAQDQEKLH